MKRKLSQQERARLHAETLCAFETIDAWWDGRNVRDASKFRLDGAAEKLGIAPEAGAVAR